VSASRKDSADLIKSVGTLIPSDETSETIDERQKNERSIKERKYHLHRS